MHFILVIVLDILLRNKRETCVKDGSRGDDSMTSATEQLTSPTGYCQNHVETFAAKLAVAADDYNRRRGRYPSQVKYLFVQIKEMVWGHRPSQQPGKAVQQEEDKMNITFTPKEILTKQIGKKLQNYGSEFDKKLAGKMVLNKPPEPC